MKLSNKTYDILKYVAQYVLPGLGTLYFALSTIWGLPYGEQVVGTITAIDTFLGVLLGISVSSYSGDGTLKIDTSDPNKDRYLLDVNMPVDQIKTQKQITLKVDPKASLKPDVKG